MNAPFIYQNENSEPGGYAATSQALDEHPDIDCLFFLNDIQALGALRLFREKNIRIPEDIEFIAVGTSQLERCAFCYPSISVVHLPIEEAAARCINQLYQLITYQKKEIETESLAVPYIARESCP